MGGHLLLILTLQGALFRKQRQAYHKEYFPEDEGRNKNAKKHIKNRTTKISYSDGRTCAKHISENWQSKEENRVD